MKKMIQSILKNVGKTSVLMLVLFSGLVLTTGIFGASGATDGLKLTNISNNIASSVGHISVILSNVALIAGIGFIMAAFFKFHQHKLNPTQVPLSQGITLLLIGAGLTLFPVMIPSAKTAIAGSTAAVSKLSGSTIKSLIGASS